MNIYDYILLAILAFFIYRGVRSGFVAMIGGFIGIVLGAWAAGQYYDLVAQWLVEYFNANLMMAIVLAFIIIYLLVNIIIGILVKIISVVFRIIPLATTTNRIIGATLGLLEGLLLIGLIIWIINLFPFQSAFAKGLGESRVAQLFENSTKIVQPLLPKSLKDVNFDMLQNLNDLTDEKAQYLQQFMPDLLKKLEQKHDTLQEKYDREIESQSTNASTTTAY